MSEELVEYIIGNLEIVIGGLELEITNIQNQISRLRQVFSNHPENFMPQKKGTESD